MLPLFHRYEVLVNICFIDITLCRSEKSIWCFWFYNYFAFNLRWWNYL